MIIDLSGPRLALLLGLTAALEEHLGLIVLRLLVDIVLPPGFGDTHSCLAGRA